MMICNGNGNGNDYDYVRRVRACFISSPTGALSPNVNGPLLWPLLLLLLVPLMPALLLLLVLLEVVVDVGMVAAVLGLIFNVPF
jgi:hypothetical protein